MPIRIVTTHVEFEGQVSEQRVVIEGEEPPAWGADADLAVVGKSTPRVDGRERATGAARYAHDTQLPGMLTAVVLGSSYPHARVVSVDTSAAEKMPGVRAILHRFNAGQLIDPTRKHPLFPEEVLFQGEFVAVIFADTLEQAEDARNAITVQYEPLPFVVEPEAALADGAPRINTANARNTISDEWPKTYQRGDVERGFADADETVEVRFETPTQLHNSMETHGAAANWDGRTLTLWSSTQNIHGVRRGVANFLGLQQNQVHVIKQYMGGGFGSKLGPHKAELIAAYTARLLTRPVKFMLSREMENLAAGNRPTSVQYLRIGAKRDGALTAVDLRAIENVGAYGDWFASVAWPAKELYQCDNVRTVDVPARTNLGSQASFRAPGVVEGMTAFEVAIDRMAHAIGMDPLEFRKKNYAERYQLLDRPYADKALLEMYAIGAERIGWATRDAEERRFPRGRDGYVRRGIGMASQLWGGEGGPPAQAIAKLLPDGTAVILTGTQDIGTGTRTVLAQIAAEELGIPLAQVRVELGDTEYGVFSPASGGSMTLTSVGPAVRMAAVEAKKEALEAIGHLTEAPVDVLEIRDGSVFARDTGRELGTLRSFLSQLDGHEITARGMRGPNAEDVAIRTFGAQFIEVEVDTGTGMVTVRRVVAVHDCGRIVNPLTFSSQIEGGIIQGIGLALTEQRVVDTRLGTVLNANLETYKVPTIRDVPEIDIIALNRANTAANTIGALGAGEPPIIPTAGAIANAVAHALGRPVSALPLTPDRVLDLLK
jgi:xanthine dehydrogenase YagR molybdenum-binding subunit